MFENRIINILIIESDPYKASAVTNALQELGIDFNLLRHISKAREAVEYLNEKKYVKPDLIFSNYRMVDGLQSWVFDQVKEAYHVIFITGSEDFPKEKKGSLLVDRVCLPITTQKIKSAMAYFDEMTGALSKIEQEQKIYIAPTLPQHEQQKVKFLVLKKGTEYKNIRTEDVVFVYSENKLAFAVTKMGQKYLSLTNLKGLEYDLPADNFFRANRNTIINREHIDSFKTVEKVKIEVRFIAAPNIDFGSVIISQDNAVYFRQWIGLKNSLNETLY